MHKGATSLLIIDVDSGMATPLPSEWQAFFGLALIGERLYFIGGSPDRLATITSMDLSGCARRTDRHRRSAGREPDVFSMPESIEYPTRDGAIAYAYFYAPRNPDVHAPSDERPPLLVMSHGGPTAATHPLINFRIQYYTTRGWAVADVNYGGSSGYGRAYRGNASTANGVSSTCMTAKTS